MGYQILNFKQKIEFAWVDLKRAHVDPGALSCFIGFRDKILLFLSQNGSARITCVSSCTKNISQWVGPPIGCVGFLQFLISILYYTILYKN